MNSNSPIVIDSKPDYTRAGLSSGDVPTVVSPTNSISSKAPMSIDGIVTNWDSMIAVWSHTFKQLGVDPSQHLILVTEPPLNPKINREKMTKIFFETFNVPGLYLTQGEILALYDAEKLTGTMVSFSANGRFVVVVPCYDRFPYTHAIIQRSFDSNELSDSDIVGISEMIYHSIFICDVDVRPTLFENIVLTGNSSMFPGIATKIQKQVTQFAPAAQTVKVIETTDPQNGAWRGGDKLAPLLSEYGSWMTKQEYGHFEARLVHRKCF